MRTRQWLPAAICLLMVCAVSGLEPGSANTFERTTTNRYRLDPSQSKFVAHAFAGGLLWFKGHDHLVAARDFSGEAQITIDSINPASLQLVVKSDSMAETNLVFTDQQKQIINKELHDIVLEPPKYPEIVFRSSNVQGKALGNGAYDVKIGGELSLHGVTRPIIIPARVVLTGNDLKANGEFSINRSDYKVKATSAVHGMVRVRQRIKFVFEIVGHRI